jgi:hypothetical protein
MRSGGGFFGGAGTDPDLVVNDLREFFTTLA